MIDDSEANDLEHKPGDADVIAGKLEVDPSVLFNNVLNLLEKMMIASLKKVQH